MVLASLDSFLGSLWFAGLTLVIGYVAGHVFPITSIKKLFGKD